MNAAETEMGSTSSRPRNPTGLHEVLPVSVPRERLGVLAETRPTARSLGLYIHVPFCEQRCFYCAFNTAPFDGQAMGHYLGALDREIDLLTAAPWARSVVLTSIFFGGGTPSLLAPADLATVLARLRTSFATDPDAEITVEANPESVTRAKLTMYRLAGVNRLSLGVQSLDDAILRRLGRLHDGRTARQAFDHARAAGFTNVSVDLMYGLPTLDVEGWVRVITAVLDWEPDHLSAYGLSLDAGSLWGTTGIDNLPAEDEVAGQYWALAHQARRRGYEHYEISNYARPGFRSRHNAQYWRDGEYLACGPGACGFIGDIRYGNVKPLSRYVRLLERDTLPIDTFERLTPRHQLAERLFLGLRTSDGVPRAWLTERLTDDVALRDRVRAWEDGGLLIDADGRVRLSEAGFLVSDSLFVELL